MKTKKKGRGGDDVPIFTDLLLSFFSRGKATWRDQFVARVSVTQGPCVSRSTLDDLEQTDDRCLLLLAFRFPHSTVAYPVIGRGKYPSHASHSLLQQRVSYQEWNRASTNESTRFPVSPFPRLEYAAWFPRGSPRDFSNARKIPTLEFRKDHRQCSSRSNPYFKE